jgi:hypothetical protein
MSGETMNHEIEAIVERVVPGARVLAAGRLSGGVSAIITGVTIARADGGEERIVIRQHREVVGKPAPGERARREFALLEALHARGVPVPRPWRRSRSSSIGCRETRRCRRTRRERWRRGFSRSTTSIPRDFRSQMRSRIPCRTCESGSLD